MSAPIVEVPNTLSSLLLAQLAPIATQAADAGMIALRTELASLQADVATNQHAVETALAGAGSTILIKAAADPWTQRAIALAVVGAVILGCLVTLVSYYAGNPQAAKVIAGVPAAITGLVLLLARLDGVTLPKTLSK